MGSALKESSFLPFHSYLIFLFQFYLQTTAMARINMIKSAVSRRTSAHAPMDNVTTPYNPIRLLKGAPPGQVSCKFRQVSFSIMIKIIITWYKCISWYFSPSKERVNFYASELNIMGQHHRAQEKANAHHLFEVESQGKYDYHHNIYKPGVDRNRKFWEPEKIKDYVGRM